MSIVMQIYLIFTKVDNGYTSSAQSSDGFSRPGPINHLVTGLHFHGSEFGSFSKSIYKAKYFLLSCLKTVKCTQQKPSIKNIALPASKIYKISLKSK